jgi:hypothetical protein
VEVLQTRNITASSGGEKEKKYIMIVMLSNRKEKNGKSKDEKIKKTLAEKIEINREKRGKMTESKKRTR